MGGEFVETVEGLVFVVEGGGFGVYVFGLAAVGVDEASGEGDGLSLGVADWKQSLYTCLCEVGFLLLWLV